MAPASTRTDGNSPRRWGVRIEIWAPPAIQSGSTRVKAPPATALRQSPPGSTATPRCCRAAALSERRSSAHSRGGRWPQRLNPKKADLQAWREAFAEALREQGIEAEATPRRARGVTRKAERGPVRRMSERASAGGGAMPVVRQAAYRDAASAAFLGDTAPRPWEAKTAARQAAIRGLYLAQAKVLQRSAAAEDRELGRRVEQFVQAMPAPDSQRLALARELRAANARESARTAAHPGRAKDRLGAGSPTLACLRSGPSRGNRGRS